MKTAIAIIMALMLCASLALADITEKIAYQGRLTDDSGAPVADGDYTVTFSIYKSKTDIAPYWTSGERTVSVSGGLFTYKLGTFVPLPQNTFIADNRWLGIKVGSDPEISPRIELTSTPYAYQALRADTADVLSDDDDYVHTAGDTLTGSVYFVGDDGIQDCYIRSGDGFGNLYLYDGGDTKVYLVGDTYGTLILRDLDNTSTINLSATGSSGGELYLRTATGSDAIVMDAGETGDNAVEFPDKAINSDEILNEAGIVTRYNTSSESVAAATSMIDIETITIYTPAAGYIHVAARYTVGWQGVSGSRGVFAQIDATSGGTHTSPYYQYCFYDSLPSFNSYRFPGYVDRVYYVSSAGTYTYRLEGYSNGDGGGFVYIYNSYLTAQYFPTGYGSVKASVSDPAGFDEAIPYQITDEEGNTTTAYEVDLRELEMKAKEAKIKALEAELELRRARDEAERRESE